MVGGGHLTSNVDWTLSLLSSPDVIAVNQTGRNARECFKDCHQAAAVWQSRLPDQSYALALFSFDGRREPQIRMRHDEAGLPPRIHVRDLWSQKDLGVFDGEFTDCIASSQRQWRQLYPSDRWPVADRGRR